MNRNLFIALLLVATSAAAWDDDPAYQGQGGGNTGYTPSVQPRYVSDPTQRYRGTTEFDGYTQMRDVSGHTVRGYVEPDGYGTLRDQTGATYPVRPE